MFTVIRLMLAGMLAGFLLRKHALEFIRPTITVLIWALLFLLGVEVGGNEDILRGLHTIGLEAVVLTLGGTLGSKVNKKIDDDGVNKLFIALMIVIIIINIYNAVKFGIAS